MSGPGQKSWFWRRRTGARCGVWQRAAVERDLPWRGRPCCRFAPDRPQPFSRRIVRRLRREPM